MVDPDIIARRVLSLNEALLHLATKASDLTANMLAAEPMLQAAVERWLQIAIEACIDISYHVVAERGWTPPDTARNAFELLGAHGLIPLGLAVNLGRAAGMRNILVHDYARVDREILVVAVASALSDLRDFGSAVGKLIDADASQG
jgi:uncharacterized protein YutE (UPF0331/DUF86 family)